MDLDLRRAQPFTFLGPGAPGSKEPISGTTDTDAMYREVRLQLIVWGVVASVATLAAGVAIGRATKR